MSYQFIKAGLKAEMICVIMDNQKVWLFCSPEVKNYAKNMFKEGDMIDFTYEKEGDNRYKITSKVTKAGTSQPKVEEAKSEEPKVEEKEVVEEQKPIVNSVSETPTSSSAKTYNNWQKSPDTQESIKRQAIGNMVSRSLIALQGQVTPNNIEETTRKLYALYQELVG